MSVSPIAPKPLFRLDECPELMADACVGDEDGMLVFLSLWGRDTAVQEFLARLTLGQGDELGLDRLHVLNAAGGTFQVFVGEADRLEKRLTRADRRTLFGALTHLWLFDQSCIRPDQAHAMALALLPRDSSCRQERLWRLTRETCPLPLLDPWRDTVLDLLQARSMLTRLPLALGPLEGFRLTIDVPALTQALGDLIRQDVLTADPALPPQLKAT